MAVAKVTINNSTILDLTDATAGAPQITAPYTAYGSTGEKLTGTGSGGGGTPTLQAKTKTYTPTTSQQTEDVTPDSGYDGLSKVTVKVNAIPSQYIIPTGTKRITANGTGIDVSAYASVDVAVPSSSPTLQTKSVSYTPTETAQSASITPDAGYDALSQVNVSVGAISSTYVGTGITRRSSSDLSAYGASVSVPAGFYESAASKSVATASQATPSVSIDANGLVTATATQAAGYVSAGTKTGTLQLTKRTSSDLTESNLTVTAPAGYYPAAASKQVTVPTGSATTPTTTIQANPTLIINGTTGEITSSVSQSQNVTPTVVEGWVSEGTAGNVIVSGSATEQLTVLSDSDITPLLTDSTLAKDNGVSIPSGFIPTGGISTLGLFREMSASTMDTFTITANGDVTATFSPTLAGVAYRNSSYTIGKLSAVTTKAATTITPSRLQQIAVARNVYTTGQITVDPIPSEYIIPSGSQTITQNGTVDVSALAQVIVNVAGGSSGLEYETGTWTPSSDIARGEISFSNTHTEPPVAIVLADATGTTHSATNSNYLFVWLDAERMTGVGYPYSSSGYRYAAAFYGYRGSSTSSISAGGLFCSQRTTTTSSSGTSYPKYWATSTGFHPYSNSTSRYWRSGRSYKWIAIWNPTT